MTAINRIALLTILLLYSAVAVSQNVNLNVPVIEPGANHKIRLAWTSTQETNISHYSIERSYDNKTFKQVAIVFTSDDSSTVNSHSYRDPLKSTEVPVIYYRLKMVDKNGKYQYSDVKMIYLGSS